MENKNNTTGGKNLHGNNAKIDPAKHVESVFSANPVTNAERVRSQKLRDSLLDDGRDFVNDNKK